MRRHPDHDIQRRVREEADRLLVARIRSGVPVVALALGIIAIADVVEGRPHLGALLLIKLLQIVLLAWVVWTLRNPAAAGSAVRTGLVAGAGLYVSSVAAAILVQDSTMRPLLLTILVTGASTALPWGWRAQLLTVLSAAGAIAWNIHAVAGDIGSVFPYPGIVVLIALAGSVYVAYAAERSRSALIEANLASVASAARYEQILGHATDIIYRTDDTGHVTYFNPIALRLMRYTESEMMGIHFLALVRPDSRRRIGRFYLRQFVEHIPTTYCEIPAIAKDGTELWLGHNVQLIVENGQTIGFAAVARDITELKRVEDERRLLAAIVESSEDAIISETLDGTIRSWNHGAEQIYGYTAEEAIGMPVVTLLCSDPTETPSLLERVKHGQRIDDYEAMRRRKDGTPVAVSLRMSPVRDAEGGVTGASVIARDVTQRRLVEQALRDSEERFHTIAASAQDAIIMMDADGRVAFWNRAAETIFGYSEAAVLGRDLHELLAAPAFRDAATRGLAAFWPTGEGAAIGRTAEVVGLRNGGGEIPIELSLAAIQVGGRWQAVGIARDITERKRVEKLLQEARDTAEAANRAKSDFLANMSHEIRTPMNGIIGMTDLALDTTLEPEQREYLEMVKVSADSLMSVINDILDFSKIEAGKLELDPVEFNLCNVLGDVMKVQALRAHQKGLELTWRVLPDVPETLVGDPGRLMQIIVNLVGNAIKFTPQGEVAVEVEHTTASPPRERQPADGTRPSRPESARAYPRAELRFTVRDTGIGVAADKHQSIFEAFEQADGSTTRKFGGTGLGLTIARRLVNLMEGDIAVDSAVGHGSRFHFTACFGIAATAPAIRMPAVLRDLPVLVVDDNDTNRRILEETVLRWGMRPVAVASGAAALVALDETLRTGHGFALVLLDEQMPEMDGFTLAARIAQSGLPSPPALIMLTSGGQAGDAARCRALGIAAHLMKPVKPRDLLDAITRTMRASGDRVDRPAEAAGRACAAPPGGEEHMHILLVEDNIVNQRVAVRLLEKHGCTVVLANNGMEALAAFRREPFDAVLMDVQMPVMDGFEATAQIRGEEYHAAKTKGGARTPAVRGDGAATPLSSEASMHVPIIAMTAHAMVGDRERCLAAGMDGYVSKPIKPRELFEVIERVVRQRAGDGAVSC